jgi:serine/threonine protein kinase
MLTINKKQLPHNPFAEGGEAFIYSYENKLMKIYKDHVDKTEKEKRIDRWLTKKYPKNIVGPIDKIFDEKNHFVGYLMEKVEGEEFKKLGNKKTAKLYNITTKDVLKMLIEINNTMRKLQKHHIFIGDLNDVNILFDKKLNVYFIDTDSWKIEEMNATAYTESFKDPLVAVDTFNKETDTYAFAILMFKSLTRIHPFGGTSTPDMDILERMKKNLSVINNQNVILPAVSVGWKHLHPKLIENLKNIFENKLRVLDEASLEECYTNLKKCDQHSDYFYGKYNDCPVCNQHAKLITKPKQIFAQGEIPYLILFEHPDVKVMLNADTYVNIYDEVVHIASKKKVKYNPGTRYYFSDDGETSFVIEDEFFQIATGKQTFTFEKINKSQVSVCNDRIYYIHPNHTLTEITVDPRGNFIQQVAKTAFKNRFVAVDKQNFCLYNHYDQLKMLNVNGFTHSFQETTRLRDMAMHFDEVSKRWLIITEDEKNVFHTRVIDKDKIVYETSTIKYQAPMQNICMSKNVIFTPGDGLIRGFDFENNKYKDFMAPPISEESKLVKKGKHFIAINEKSVIKLG